ncbi:VOC family protein [Streptomyces solisilvae]|uniref:VOC family protein n=1 Tax=Streptomyces malaysiensis TaxID=92644 RepID=UPI00367F392D
MSDNAVINNTTDTPPQAINHIDHVGIIVHRDNVQKYTDLFTQVLGITFDEPIVNHDAGVIAVLSWGSGFELMAPLRDEGPYYERLQKFGEGTCTIIFGVPDIDAAIERAGREGAPLDFEVELEGDEPWLARFKQFREARLKAFDDDFALSLTLSQIEPV